MKDNKRCDNCVWGIRCNGKWICSSADTGKYATEVKRDYVCEKHEAY